jgi:hypothetical protein
LKITLQNLETRAEYLANFMVKEEEINLLQFLDPQGSDNR